MLKNTLIPLLLVALFTLPAQTGTAQSVISLEDVAKVTLVQGWRTKRGTHMAAIRISLAEGWKTYWRSAGEAGITPRFDWAGSENLQNVRFHWPTPKVFDPDGARSYGYKGEVVIPIELTPKQSGGGEIILHGQMEIGVCLDVCVPMAVTIKGAFAQGGTPDPLITASLKHHPISADSADVRSTTCRIEPIDDGLRIAATINLPKQGGDEIVVFELPDPSIWIAESTTTRKGRQLTATTELVPANAAPFMLSRSDIRMTVFGKNGTVDIQGCSAG